MDEASNKIIDPLGQIIRLFISEDFIPLTS